MAVAINTRAVRNAWLKKARKLNVPGDVLVKLGQTVAPHTAIAKTDFVRGNPKVIDLNADLGVHLTPELMDQVFFKKVGDRVTKGEVIARYQKRFWSKVEEAKAPCDGVVEVVSRIQGRIVMREDPRTAMPMTICAVSKRLNVMPSMIRMFTSVREGDYVHEGQVVASAVHNPFFGEAGVDYVYTPMSGIVERICTKTGEITIVREIKPSQVKAHIAGVVTEIVPDFGCVVESNGACLEGVFGIGGEKQGRLVVASDGPGGFLDEAGIIPGHKGCVLLAGASVTLEGLRKMKDSGAVGVVVGGVNNLDLVEFLGYEINVGLTGQETPAFTVVIVEGFGSMSMGQSAWDILASSAGKVASVDGTTQIRAGVVRPQVLVSEGEPPDRAAQGPFGDGYGMPLNALANLSVGDKVRCIRQPFYGQWGTVEEIPVEPVEVESESLMEVALVRLDGSGEVVTVAEANLEVLAG